MTILTLWRWLFSRRMSAAEVERRLSLPLRWKALEVARAFSKPTVSQRLTPDEVVREATKLGRKMDDWIIGEIRKTGWMSR